MPLIACENLIMGYDGKAIAEPINFTVESGDYLCIVGENGAGKSTLIKTILRLHTQMSGKVVFGDTLTPREIGYLPQQTVVQRDFPASVWEIVLSGCKSENKLNPFYSKKQRKTAEDALKKMGIFSLKNACYRELSGGQQQRVLLCRALCATQKVILLDEPTAGLDPNAALDMYTQIEKLNSEDKITVIMISHDIGVALKFATHVLHIGKEVFFGTRQQYFESGMAKSFAKSESEVK